MSKILEAKAAEIVAKRAEATKFYDDLGDADPTREQMTFIKDLNKTIEGMEEKYKDLEEIELGKEVNQRRQKELQEPRRKSREFGDADLTKDQKRILSAGMQVLSDEGFKAWQQSIVPGSKEITKSPSVMVDAMLKTLITGASSTSGGAFVVNDRKPIFDSYYARPLTIKDLITIGETGSDTVEYVRQGTVTNNAAPVAEATATGDGTGSKPESAAAWAIITEAVKTIAHWVPATNRALADAGQLRTIIDSFLRYGLEEELEDQMLSGSGSGENFTGVYNVSGIQAQTFATNILTTSRKARTAVKVTGRAVPTAYVMHPNDWEDFDLLQDNEARYMFGGPTVLGNPRLWGVPVVESEAATEGLAILADWRMATLWDREQATVRVSDSHSDFFIRNMVAVLGEMRAAFGLIRPAAFMTIDLTA